MESARERRHGRHRHEKHKKRSHKKHRSRSRSRGAAEVYTTVTSTKPLVEYSDVSSEELSAPEAGEIESEASSSAHVRVKKGHAVRTLEGGIVSVTREYTTVPRKRRRDSLEYSEVSKEHNRHKKKKEKRRKDKKRRKKKSKRSHSGSLESVSTGEVTGRDSPGVPLSDWEKPLSPVRLPHNGSVERLSPSTPPHAPPLHRSPARR